MPTRKTRSREKISAVAVEPALRRRLSISCAPDSRVCAANGAIAVTALESVHNIPGAYYIRMRENFKRVSIDLQPNRLLEFRHRYCERGLIGSCGIAVAVKEAE